MTGISAMAFSGQVTMQSVRFKFKSMAGFTNGPVPSQRSTQLAQNHLKMEQNRICLRRLKERKSWNDRKLNLAMALGASANDFGHIESLPSASDLIRKFYACINEKRMTELGGYIAENCSFEDCSFQQPWARM
uniref:Uncharacterized protein n=1 Tax=Rhizophora mucronata TaxID=61149 RepID=A0A2P2IMP0_RHIMU